jgi:hypothetical protein
VADQEVLAILKQGPEAWNEWIRADFNEVHLYGADLGEADLSGAILNGANLSKADLLGADLHGADLHGADLGGANLSWANLIGANLYGANLHWAILNWANLYGANLYEADLSGANLRWANLARADVGGADLSQAGVGLTAFVDVDLSLVLGLESVTHHYPSSIGIDTIYRSGGKIPEVFLRDAGVPKPFIVQMKALVGAMEPIQFYKCFISYSSKDQDFAQRLYESLQARDVPCWLAKEDMKGGDHIYDQIDRAIQVHDRVLLLLSEASMTSKWVETEILKAFAKEKHEARRVLFPISLVPFEQIKAWKCFDSDTGEDLARKVRKYFIPDFSKWKDHDAYRAAFDRLLHDLKPSV